MIHAKENDYDVVKEIFSEHKQWFPHVRQDYIKRMIASGNLILDNDVIITYNYYKKKTKNRHNNSTTRRLYITSNSCQE